MHITFQAIPQTADSGALSPRVESFLLDLLAFDRDALREVTVRHGFGADAEDDHVHCDVRARLASGARVTVSHADTTLVKALQGSIGKLRKAVREDAALDFAL